MNLAVLAYNILEMCVMVAEFTVKWFVVLFETLFIGFVVTFANNPSNHSFSRKIILFDMIFSQKKRFYVFKNYFQRRILTS